jgi:hypothetical protein
MNTSILFLLFLLFSGGGSLLTPDQVQGDTGTAV